MKTSRPLSDAMIDTLDTIQRQSIAASLMRKGTVQALLSRGLIEKTPNGFVVTPAGVKRLADERFKLAAPPSRVIGELNNREFEIVSKEL